MKPPAERPLERWRLSNGLTVLYRSDADIPLAAANFIFPAGSARESFAQAGLASFTMALLTQGTQRRNASEFARSFESVGASFGTDCSEDYSDAGFVTPAKHLGKVLALVAEAFQSPRFAPEEISKEKAHTLASLRSRTDTQFNLAYDAFNVALFGARHPYGRVVEGRSASVKAFTRRACQAWQHTQVSPRGAVFSLIAPDSATTVRRLVERHFGSWCAATPSTSTKRLPVAALPRSKTLRLSAKFEQAYLMTGCQAPAVGDPASLAIKLFNMAVGGGMSSRLFLDLREKRGLAYEVASFFPTRLQTSQWVAYLGTPPEKLGEARRALKAVLERAEKGITAAELEQAKRMLKNSFWTEHQTRRRQAWYAAWWEFLGRAPDYDRQHLARIDAVTLPQVRAAGREILGRPRLTVEVSPREK